VGARAARKFHVEAIDDVIHGRLRLGIMAYLAKTEGADFTELKGALNATQGNLSIQLRKLEDAGYITIDKSFVDRKPVTRATLTRAGRKAFLDYLDAMSRLIDESTRGR
jgi:DNA-binding MarR family transcriptional regulator